MYLRRDRRPLAPGQVWLTASQVHRTSVGGRVACIRGETPPHTATLGVASTARTYLHSHGSSREPTLTRQSHRQQTEVRGPHDAYERCRETGERGHRRSFFVSQGGSYMTSRYMCRAYHISDVSTPPWIVQRVYPHAMMPSGARDTMCYPQREPPSERAERCPPTIVPCIVWRILHDQPLYVP